MTAAKAVAAFVSLLLTSLFAVPGIIPVDGTIHLVFAIIGIVAGTITTYTIPNKATPGTVIDSVLD